MAEFDGSVIKEVLGGDNNKKEEYKSIDVEKEIADFPMEPYTGRLYVVEEEVEKSHGLFIPEKFAKDGEMQTNTGYVVAIGAEVGFVKPGDRIFYGQFSGAWVMNKRYRVMNEKDILGRFKDAKSNA
jgi:co-chaperonin GroES (HSP10)